MPTAGGGVFSNAPHLAKYAVPRARLQQQKKSRASPAFVVTAAMC